MAGYYVIGLGLKKILSQTVTLSLIITREISSANLAFWSANIQRYYRLQQLIEQLSSAHGETTVKRGRINGGKSILSLIYLRNCRVINNVLFITQHE